MLATRLAKYLGVAEDPGEDLDLNTVACRYFARGNAVEDLYPAVKSLIPGDDELPIPELLLKLAAVDRFRLFVTTSFDPSWKELAIRFDLEGIRRPRSTAFPLVTGAISARIWTASRTRWCSTCSAKSRPFP